MSTQPTAPRLRPATAAALCAGVLLAACASRPPPPAPNLPPLHAAYLQAGSADALALDAATWRGFGDPMLDALLAQARDANHEVRIALARVRQARAGEQAVASRLLPTVALTGSAADQRSGLPDEVKRGSPDTRAGRVAIDLGWELDLSGAARAAADAAALDALAAEDGVAVAQWLATTEVARLYVQWQGARARLGLLEALLQAQRDTEAVTRRRASEGLASELDVSRATADTQALTAQVPALRTFVAVTGHQVDLLLGLPPGAEAEGWRAQAPRSLPQAPELAPGQPVSLLERRPDLRVAQRQWQAESARWRESQADRLPRIFLSAVLGRQDLRLNALDLTPVGYRNVALAFAWPLFNAGRLEAAETRQLGRERAAALQAERAVLGALQDVENSLVALAQARASTAAQQAAFEARTRGWRLASSLQREGQIDRLPWLDARRGALSAELALTEARTHEAQAAVQLVKALGGGWFQPAPGAALSAAPTNAHPSPPARP